MAVLAAGIPTRAVVAAPALRVVLPVASGLYPAVVGVSPAVAVPIPEAAGVPSPED
jgi:hypothetical protein